MSSSKYVQLGDRRTGGSRPCQPHLPRSWVPETAGHRGPGLHVCPLEGGSESQWDYLRVLNGTSKSFTPSHWPRVEKGWAGRPLELSTERQGALEK